LSGTTLTLTKWEGSGIGTVVLTKAGGGGGGGSGLTAVSGGFTASTVLVHCNANFSEVISVEEEEGLSGLSVKKNGISLELRKIYVFSGQPVITVNLTVNNILSASDTVTVSYDGTSGALAGKVKAFTDLPATWNASL
jgi:hypothetical protein